MAREEGGGKGWKERRGMGRGNGVLGRGRRGGRGEGMWGLGAQTQAGWQEPPS